MGVDEGEQGRERLELLVALDEAHLREWRLTYPTWLRHNPEIVDIPINIVVDTVRRDKEWWFDTLAMDNDAFILHRKTNIIGWNWRPDLPQRERMLSSLVYVGGSLNCDTYLKLDVDAVATGATVLRRERGNNAFVAPPWGYTKPADALAKLDEWGNAHPVLKRYPPLNVPYAPGSPRVRHNRIISWMFWGSVEFTKICCRLAAGASESDWRLPVPSQDTFLWYCARRMQMPWNTFRPAGWRHIGSSFARLEQAVKEAG